jgi:hypothetical protein
MGTTRIWAVQNEEIEGDSHLALTVRKDARPSPNADAGLVATVQVRRQGAEAAELILEPNREGRLSKVKMSLKAENFSDAESKAYYEVSAFLSNLAFELDIPLHIAHTLIKESATMSVRVGFVRQFGYKGAGNLPEHAFLDRGPGMEMKGWHRPKASPGSRREYPTNLLRKMKAVGFGSVTIATPVPVASLACGASYASASPGERRDDLLLNWL